MSTYTLNDLLYLVARLRKPESGCPWDIAQDYRSITPSTIEEVYEVVDAIEQEDYAHLKEELGDLLFQVVLYSQLAAEDTHFDFKQIVHHLTEKLLRRHPHVFPDGSLQSERDPSVPVDVAQIKNTWESIKAKERTYKGKAGILDDVPLSLPALQRAQKLQKRVAKAGMDFRSIDAAMSKLHEEISELSQAIANRDKDSIEEELGDLLFCCVNLARHLSADADASLRRANSKFERRIHAMESLLDASQSLHDCDDDELEALWQRAKMHSRR